MAKRKGKTHEEKLMDALRKLPCPLEDKKHRIKIFFIDDRARSNQTRYEHIISVKHVLYVRDIERIPEKINESILKKDPERTDTYNLYIPRNSYNDEYIKISLWLDYKKSNEAIVKTIFITTNLK